MQTHVSRAGTVGGWRGMEVGWGVMGDAGKTVIHALLVEPMRTLFFHGPALGGYGFLNGVAPADACAAITGISAVVWAGSDTPRAECDALLERRFDSFAQATIAAAYLVVLGFTAARAWSWAWMGLHETCRRARHARNTFKTPMQPMKRRRHQHSIDNAPSEDSRSSSGDSRGRGSETDEEQQVKKLRLPLFSPSASPHKRAVNTNAFKPFKPFKRHLDLRPPTPPRKS